MLDQRDSKTHHMGLERAECGAALNHKATDQLALAAKNEGAISEIARSNIEYNSKYFIYGDINMT